MLQLLKYKTHLCTFYTCDNWLYRVINWTVYLKNVAESWEIQEENLFGRIVDRKT